jgi:hypothetical protein
MLVRMRKAWAVAGLCAALMLAGVLTGLRTAGASAAGCPGKLVHLFDPSDQDNIFTGVAAVSACDIWEVGKSANSNSASAGCRTPHVAFPDSTRKNEEKRAQDATHQARRSSGWVVGSGIHGR